MKRFTDLQRRLIICRIRNWMVYFGPPGPQPLRPEPLRDFVLWTPVPEIAGIETFLDRVQKRRHPEESLRNRALEESSDHR